MSVTRVYDDAEGDPYTKIFNILLGVRLVFWISSQLYTFFALV